MKSPRKETCAALLATLLLGIASINHAPAAQESDAVSTFRLILDAPVTTWDEAVPLGNGMLGGLLWGTDNTINLSLDRSDLWDETTPPEILEGNWNYANMRKLVEEDFGEFLRRYDGTYNHPAPTKLPGGRLVLTLGPTKKAKTFTLDMKRAMGTVTFDDGSRLDCFFHATERVALIRVDDTGVTSQFLRPGGIDRLNYPPARFGQDDDTSWMLQQAAEGLVYATLTVKRRIGNQTFLAVAITTNREDPGRPDPLALARSRIAKALDDGFDGMLHSHQQWWNDFWATSEVTIPDERIQRHYNLVKYFYGAASRPDAPSMPLQAVWTQDSGGLPPWKGDFHHDLNTQMTYLAYHKAGLTDSGMSFINHMWDLLPEYRRFAKDFFGVDGAAVPCVMTLNGKPLGGWPQYTLSPTYAIWIGQSFYLHWKHTMDHQFLRERAYPWMDENVNAIVQLLEERDGKLYLPLSSSSEIFDASRRAFLKPNSNQDLSMLQWAFEAMAEMAHALGKEGDVAKWRSLRKKLNDLHVDDDVLMFSSDEPFNQSHRHHAHAMAIHPFATLNIDGSDEDRRLVQATLQRMDELGTRAWTGYSFSWFACLLARAGQPELAFQYLTYYERAFILRNGFHCNGDQIGTGLSGFGYRPFTLEGNFLAMEAVHDMVLQSWPVSIAEDPTPVIRIFPAMPWRWRQASFRDLRAEGGFVVSAQRENNGATGFEIRATVDGLLRLRDNFDGRTPAFNHDVTRDGRDFVLNMKAGQTLVGTLDKPDALPPEPEQSREVTKRLERIEELHAMRDLKIKSTKIPLRIGADSNGQNCFRGEMARVSLFSRVLSAEEIAALAVQDGDSPGGMDDCVVSYDFHGGRNGSYPSTGGKTFPAQVTGQLPEIDAGPLGIALHFDGGGFLGVAHDPALDCNGAITLEAWIHPRATGSNRIIDKSVAGIASGYALDLLGGSLRLMSNARASHPTSIAKIPTGQWIHVAATIDGKTGEFAMYIDGKEVPVR